jgi:hypothetical protein
MRLTLEKSGADAHRYTRAMGASEPTFGFAHAPDGRSIAYGWAGSGPPLVMVPV